MTDDGDVLPLSFGPQEWKWFLQHRNLGSSSSNETMKWEINSEGHQCDIAALPPDAFTAIPGGGVTQGLTWLHRVQFQDLAALKKAVVHAQCQQDLLKKRVELLFEEDCSLAEQNWRLHCSELGVGDHVITLETIDISQAISNWWTMKNDDPQQKEQQQHDLQRRGLSQQDGEFLQRVRMHYETHPCKRRTHPSSSSIHATTASLQQFLESGRVTNEEELRNDLHELLAFVQSRRIDCSKRQQQQQHTPAFMLLVASEDEGMLSSYESGLKRVISDIGAAPLSDTSTTRIIRQLESKQARVVKSRTRLETGRMQLQAVDSEIQALQDDVDKCRKRVESTKLYLEQEIAKLLRCEQVQILMEE